MFGDGCDSVIIGVTVLYLAEIDLETRKQLLMIINYISHCQESDHRMLEATYTLTINYSMCIHDTYRIGGKSTDMYP